MGTDPFLDPWIGLWGDCLVYFLRSLLPSAAYGDLAQDAAQETFLRFYRWHRRRPAQPVHAGILLTIGRPVAVDYQRQVGKGGATRPYPRRDGLHLGDQRDAVSPGRIQPRERPAAGGPLELNRRTG